MSIVKHRNIFNLYHFALITLTVALVNCAGKIPTQEMGSVRRRQLQDQQLGKWLDATYSETAKVTVTYMTNRLTEDTHRMCDDQTYGYKPSPRLSFGRCDVNVPMNHPIGMVTPAKGPRDSSHDFYRVLDHELLSRERFAQWLAEDQSKDLLVFVHGFNVPFSQAILRTSQLIYDLKLALPVLLFSWPAGSDHGVMLQNTYRTDRQHARQSDRAVNELLKLLDNSERKVHLMIHSMGHQAVLPVLSQFAQSQPSRRPVKLIGELVLHAPDIDLDDFRKHLNAIHNIADRITVYCSHRDTAITASRIYNRSERLGHCAHLGQVDVINVGELTDSLNHLDYLGHSYYASRPLLADLLQVLLGIDAERRLFIKKAEPNAAENYFLRP